MKSPIGKKTALNSRGGSKLRAFIHFAGKKLVVLHRLRDRRIDSATAANP